jgi:predicted dehydrogenase
LDERSIALVRRFCNFFSGGAQIMAKKYRVAVIGRTGKGNYGHGLDTVWLALDDVEIVAVADENEKGRAACAARLKARNAYADYRQMLEKERPQIVSVADRWLDTHRDMVVACAEAGASIFLEKPMCRTLAEADQMVAACERHHVKLAIAHQTRYSPRLQRVKEMIEAGQLGDILELRGRGKEDARGGGQDLMVLGTHIMDLM